MDMRNKITEDMVQPKLERCLSDEEGSSDYLFELSDNDSDTSDVRWAPLPAPPGTPPSRHSLLRAALPSLTTGATRRLSSSQPFVMCRQCPGYRKDGVHGASVSGATRGEQFAKPLGEGPSTSAGTPSGTPEIGTLGVPHPGSVI